MRGRRVVPAGEHPHGSLAQHEVVGAVAALPQTARGGDGRELLQRSSAGVRPHPLEAHEDVARPVRDGCRVSRAGTDLAPNCVYAHARSATTVVMIGDSHMAQYFAPLYDISVRRGWRLVVLTKSGCPSAQVSVHRNGRHYTECDIWRRKALAHIAKLRHLTDTFARTLTAWMQRRLPGPPDGPWRGSRRGGRA